MPSRGRAHEANNILYYSWRRSRYRLSTTALPANAIRNLGPWISSLMKNLSDADLDGIARYVSSPRNGFYTAPSNRLSLCRTPEATCSFIQAMLDGLVFLADQ